VVAGVTAGSFDLKAFARQARFDQDRARILPDAFTRASEELASSQAAPADDEGVSLQYASGGLVAGLDARRVFGRSQETLHPAPLSPAAVIARNASGEQQQEGVFVEEVVSPLDWLRLQGALRFDLWRNLGGIRHEQLASGALRDTDLPDRSDRSLAPPHARRSEPAPTSRSRTWHSGSNLPCSATDRSDHGSGAWIASSGCGSPADGPGGEMRCISFAPRP